MRKYSVTFFDWIHNCPVSSVIVSFSNVNDCALWANKVCNCIAFDTGIPCRFVIKGLNGDNP